MFQQNLSCCIPLIIYSGLLVLYFHVIKMKISTKFVLLAVLEFSFMIQCAYESIFEQPMWIYYDLVVFK